MEELDNNIDYCIKEINNSKKNIQQNEIMDIIDERLKIIQETKYDDAFDRLLTTQIFYDENYTKKQLTLISQYYSLSTRKKRKSDLIQDIILFENDPTNEEITNKRKLMWFYLNELYNDRFLKKFIIYN
tara:strand:+ start:1427 stop:1813 length:387 start_codon:yes stop_codon:yes gene_type:complete